MEMAVESMESMEMAPGAIPYPGRVPEQRFLSLEIGLRRRRCCGTFLGETPIDLGFSLQGLFIGEGAMSEDGQGPHTIGWRTQGSTHATTWCGCPLAPLWLFFGLRLVSGGNRNFGLRFVQFREYFLCNFSETQKQQKTGNWHCGISSIGWFQKMHKDAMKCKQNTNQLV
jgi:hypothetical protein